MYEYQSQAINDKIWRFVARELVILGFDVDLVNIDPEGGTTMFWDSSPEYPLTLATSVISAADKYLIDVSAQ